MQKRIRTPKTIIISLFVVFLLVSTCSVFTFTANADPSVSQTFEQMNDGATKMFHVEVTTEDSQTLNRYLKVVKDGAGLMVFEADSIDGALNSTNPSSNLSGSVYQESSQEIWIITAYPDTYTTLSNLEELSPESWGGTYSLTFSGDNESDIVKYLSGKFFGSDGYGRTKYLKVVKKNESPTSGNLDVYEMSSITDVAMMEPIVSTNLMGNWVYDNYSQKETWTISVTGNNYLYFKSLEEIKPILEVSDLPTSIGLPEGSTNYCQVSLKRSDGTIENAYLKVVKNTVNISVFKGNTLDSFSEESDHNFAVVSIISNASQPYSEIWYLALAADGGPGNNVYSSIITVSPLYTNVTAKKVWNGRTSGNYVNVVNNTKVEFELTRNGEYENTIWVKKADGKLQVSYSNDDNSYSDYLIENGKTINALLIPAKNDTTSEEWILTLTGYEKQDVNGLLIDYRITEKDILSTQHWRTTRTEMKNTFAGQEQFTADINYTLVLKPVIGKEIDLLRITKSVSQNKVSSISVQGLDCKLDTSIDAMNYTCATVTEAHCGDAGMTSSDNKITFNNDSIIKLKDIISNPEGVTVVFHTGVDNGCASVTIKLTQAGKLSYEFKDLPADFYMVDPNTELSTIDVASYSVKTTKRTLG